MKRDRILIADDVEINRTMLKEILGAQYDIIEASNGLEAVDQVMSNLGALSLVLLDVVMPEMSGAQVLEILVKGNYTHNVPVIIITGSESPGAEEKFLTAGASDYITKPFHPKNVTSRVALQIELRNQRLRMECTLKENLSKIFTMREKIIDLLATVIEYRDLESGKHVNRTRLIAEELLNKIMQDDNLRHKFQNEDVGAIARAVSMHDIGKIGVPDNILLKPAKLTPEEFEVIKKHTTLGAQIIKHIAGVEEDPYLKTCHDICLYHHERWDGKGYPEGKRGEDIPFAARVMCIVDVYDALTTARVYKPAYTHEDAVIILKQGRGTQFDPEILDIFLEHHELFNRIHEMTLQN